MLAGTEALLGRTIADYQLLAILGQGGMGAVYLGQHIDEPQTQVALKVLLPLHYSSPQLFTSYQTRFAREAHVMSQLHHKHIVPVRDFGECGDFAYFTMPYLVGGTLAAFLSTLDEPLSLETIARYLRQLANALDYAHQKGVVHCDIKPGNVLFDGGDNLYLTDFGIARIFPNGIETFDAALTSLSLNGEMFGTPAYMAPELFQGEPATPAADIYALGVLLYRLVTGCIPFQGNSPFNLGIKHLSETPLQPHCLRPELSEFASAVILRALAKRPEERFVSAGALAQAFEMAISESEMASRLLSPVQRLPVQRYRPTVRGDLETQETCPRRMASFSVPSYRQYTILAAFLLTGVMLLAFSMGLAVGRQNVRAPSAYLGSEEPAAQQISPASASPPVRSHLPSVNGRDRLASEVTLVIHRNRLFALRGDNHRLLWHYKTTGSIISPPRSRGGVVFVVTKQGRVYALRTATGVSVWRYNLKHSTSNPPSIKRGTLYINTNDGSIYALNTTNGRLLSVQPALA